MSGADAYRMATVACYPHVLRILLHALEPGTSRRVCHAITGTDLALEATRRLAIPAQSHRRQGEGATTPGPSSFPDACFQLRRVLTERTMQAGPPRCGHCPPPHRARPGGCARAVQGR
eukprot:1176900-Rhodomonas_salina.5